MLLDWAGGKNGFPGVLVWNRAAFQGEYLQRRSCRQETQPELSGAAAPARIPACPPSTGRLQNEGEEAKQKVGGAGWEKAGAASSSTQQLRSVPREPVAQVFPHTTANRLSSFQLLLFFQGAAVQFHTRSPSKAQLGGLTTNKHPKTKDDACQCTET